MAGPVRISILANAQNAVSGIRATNTELTGLGKVGGKLSGVLKGTLVGGALAAGAALAVFAKNSVQGAQESLAIHRVFESQLDRMGAAGRKAFGDGTEFAGRFGDKIGEDDDRVLSVVNKLSTFPNAFKKGALGAEAMHRATRAAFDLEAAGIGSAESNIIGVGKALDNPIKGMTALSKAGVSFNEAEKTAIEAAVKRGDLAKAQEILLKGIESNAKGAAEAAVSGVDKLKTRLANVGEEIASNLLPKFDAFAQKLSEKLPGIVDGITAGFQRLAAIVGNPVFQTFAVAIAAVVVALTAYGVAVRIATALQAVFNVVTAASGIGLIVLAVIALVAAVIFAWKNFDGFREGVLAVWEAIKSGATGLWEGIKTGATAVKDWVVAAWNFIKTSAEAVWNAIKTAVTAVIAVLTSTVTVYRAAVITIWNAIKTAGEAVWNAIKTVINVVILAITVYINTYRAVVVAVWNAIRSAGEAVWNAIRSAISAAITFGSNVINNFRATVAGVWGAIRDAASAAWNRVAAVIFEKMQAAKEKVESVIDRIKGLFSAGALFDAGRQLIQGLINGIQSAIGGAVDAVAGGLSRIKSLLPGSPIQAGPLKSWNNGGAGKRLMDLLIFGVRSRVPVLNSILDGVTSELGDPAALSATGALAATGAPVGAGGVFRFEGQPSTLEGRAIIDALAEYTRLNGPARIEVAA